MIQYPEKRIILIMGTLGSGKGTQAEALAKIFGLSHFDTGEFLKAFFDSDDQDIFKEREEYNSGKWVSPEFVAKKVLEKVRGIISNYKGLAFSGSPRTLTEAEQELPFFEELVGQSNVKVFYLNINEGESLKRSSGRLICEKNRHPIPNLPEFQEIRLKGVCPEDGSPLVKKTLDKPEILKNRLAEHNNRTVPVLDYLRNRGYKVVEINGEQPINKVTEDILKHIS